MNISVGVIDYGMGNLHSVAKALALQGASVTVTDDRRKLNSSDLLVLPGVGAFGAAMTTLAKKKLDDFVRTWISDEKPYLGICLGFQLLFDSSEESPGQEGLGALPGRVVRFQKKDFSAKNYKVPHMGWNTARRGLNAGKTHFKGINAEDYFYFVHTFFPVPRDKEVICTTTTYGKPFCSSVTRRGLFASQFHPEKSGRVGLTLLKNIEAAAGKRS
jgi:imidazole glycerol-phosphate synthase subunit HisH